MTISSYWKWGRFCQAEAKWKEAGSDRCGHLLADDNGLNSSRGKLERRAWGRRWMERKSTTKVYFWHAFVLRPKGLSPKARLYFPVDCRSTRKWMILPHYLLLSRERNLVAVIFEPLWIQVGTRFASVCLLKKFRYFFTYDFYRRCFYILAQNFLRVYHCQVVKWSVKLKSAGISAHADFLLQQSSSVWNLR